MFQFVSITYDNVKNVMQFFFYCSFINLIPCLSVYLTYVFAVKIIFYISSNEKSTFIYVWFLNINSRCYHLFQKIWCFFNRQFISDFSRVRFNTDLIHRNLSLKSYSTINLLKKKKGAISCFAIVTILLLILVDFSK